MTDQHPAVTYLLAAHERATALADRANGTHWDASPGDGPNEAWIMNEHMHLFETDPETAAFIEASDPASVLRRVEAEREILAEHPPIRGLTGFARPAWICETCAEADWAGDRRGDPYPCRTVLLLAKTWGWKAAA